MTRRMRGRDRSRTVAACLIVALIVVGVAALLPAAESEDANAAFGTEVQKLAGRGVYYIEGRVRSPVGEIGSRPVDATNRLVLDDEHTTAWVDLAQHRITLRNEHRYGLNQLVGCLLLIGEGETESGLKAPVAVHLKIKKSLDLFTTSLHPHPTVRDNIVRATFELFEVVLDNGDSEKIALTPEEAVEAVRDPALTARLANNFMQVVDHLEGEKIDPKKPGTPLVDLSFGFGSQSVKLNLARVQLLSNSAKNAALIRKGSLAEMLEKGDWEFKVESLSPYIPNWYFDRDFFLFGIEDLPATQEIASRGLLRDETLTVGYRNGKGYIGVADRRSEIPDPADVARAYLEFHFVGGVVAHQIAKLPDRLE